MKKTFYSNGKLLITAEYLVLKGVEALALPTKMGQYLDVLPIDEPKIYWKSYDYDNSIWIDEVIKIEEVLSLQKSENPYKNQLIIILHEANILKNFLHNTGFKIETRLTFPRNWGLGSSSTLINNLAQWLEIDAFELLKKTFGGSGYDLANAKYNHPITYQLKESERIINKVVFSPVFSENLYFIYLNKKQNSRDAIAHFQTKKDNLGVEIESCNQITKSILNCDNLEEFQELVIQHENLLQNILETPTVQDTYFKDFEGVVKSLGAWGGDFCMVISKDNPKEYFKNKGFETLIPFQEMIL